MLRSLTTGEDDALWSARSWDFVIVADFDRLEDIEAYTGQGCKVAAEVADLR